MNKTLSALMTKLNWQLNQIRMQLQRLTEQEAKLAEALHHSHQQLNQATALPTVINPEREIARLNFIIQHHQQREELSQEKKELATESGQLKNKATRLEREVKMLEKYQENQQLKAQKMSLLTQQNLTDEWVLLKREPQ